MIKVCKVMALMLVAPAAFGQNSGQIKIVRAEIRRDQGNLTTNFKTMRNAHAELEARQKNELDLVRKSSASRANRAAARRAVFAKYAALWSQSRRQADARRRSLREDIAAKRAWIRKLRQS